MEAQEIRPQSTIRRVSGIAVGIGTQALFAITVVYLFSYLRYGVEAKHPRWMLIDCLLALQFAVPHSILLHPRTRQRLAAVISKEFYGLFFCLCTCASLSLIFAFWKSTDAVVWDLSGTAEALVLLAFFASWVSLFYSISLTGLGFQTGWTPWIHWYQGKRMPRRDFTARSLYRWFRHPIYLSFLGLIWFTPRMTYDHAVLTAIWSVYIVVGSVLKDERLAYYLGEPYRDYQRQVPGYPFVFFGPLARLPRQTGVSPHFQTVQDTSQKQTVSGSAA